MIEIKNTSGRVLYSVGNARNVREALEEAARAHVNLAYAYLAGAYLTDANLAGSNLTGAGLVGSNLTGAGLTRAGLAGAAGPSSERPSDEGAEFPRLGLGGEIATGARRI